MKKLNLTAYPQMIVPSGKVAAIERTIKVVIPRTLTTPPQNRPVGTQISITPTVKAKAKVDLGISTHFSEVIGHERIERVAFPLIATRVWDGAVEVPQGDAMMILVGVEDAVHKREKFILVSAYVVRR